MAVRRCGYDECVHARQKVVEVRTELVPVVVGQPGRRLRSHVGDHHPLDVLECSKRRCMEGANAPSACQTDSHGEIPLCSALSGNGGVDGYGRHDARKGQGCQQFVLTYSLYDYRIAVRYC